MPFFNAWLHTLEATVSKTPIIITITTVIGSVLVFLLARLAQRLYRSEDFILYARKMNLLSKGVLKLEISFDNDTNKDKEFRALCLYGVKGKSFTKITEVKDWPIASDDSSRFIASHHGSYDFKVPPYTKFVAVVDLHLPDQMDYESYKLGCVSEKGTLLLANFDIQSEANQEINFKRG